MIWADRNLEHKNCAQNENFDSKNRIRILNMILEF